MAISNNFADCYLINEVTRKAEKNFVIVLFIFGLGKLLRTFQWTFQALSKWMKSLVL